MGADAASPIITLDRVTKRFGDFVAVDELSFSVGEGEIVALVGKTGAGKSTALNLIMGNLAATAGSVRVAGLDPMADFAALRGRLAVGFQTDRLLPWRTAVQNVALGMQILRVPYGTCMERAKQWLARVKLEAAADKYPHELSGGMRQRVSLARALAIDPAILLLDECFSQLDHVTSKALRGDVSGLIRELGKSCLFITHRIDDAIEMADRILVLGAPARLLLEVTPTAAQRIDQAAAAVLHARIAAAMGDEDENAAGTADAPATATDLHAC
ncbi:MAG TPA: ATP-binding cassette domain-containing protein [Hyphomicrobiales bacterium]|nr:ATP-binding cassette domain-containing protein [Hyphomicrobiales bacterium]